VLFLEQYADPAQTDQLSLSAIDHVWSQVFHSPNNEAVRKIRSVFEKYLDPIDDLQNRKFTILHRIVLGLTKNVDLESQLEYSTAEINMKCSSTWTPLLWAVSRSDVGAIRILLSFDADTTVTDGFW